MILRRILQHAKNRQWGIVALDFLIVVFGVFLGIQLGNWNAASADKASYNQAMLRLEAEINTNLETVEQMDGEIKAYLERGRLGFEALRSCEQSDENANNVNTGLSVIGGTYGLSLQTQALDELTETDSLLEQQSPHIRQSLAELKFYRDLVLREASFAETIPLDYAFYNNPAVGFAEAYERKITYVGVEFTRSFRPPVLKVPVNEACQNEELMASLYIWERWQNTLPGLTRIIRAKLENSKDALGFE